MKKYLKIDFSKRDTISLVCFTIVLVLVLVLGNCFGYVHAENYRPSDNSLEDFDLFYQFGDAFDTGFNVSDLQTTSEWLDSFDSNTPFPYSNPSFFEYLDDLKVPSRMRDDWRDYWYEPDYSIYNNFIIKPTSNTEFDIILLQGECYYFFNSIICKYDDMVYNPNDLPNSDRYIILHYEISNGSVSLTRFNSYLFGGSGSEGMQSLDNGYYRKGLSSNAVFGIPVANFEVYTTKNFFSDFTDTSKQISFLDGNNDLYTPINYLLLNGNYGGNGSSSGESSLNNLYMNNPFWVFNMPSYSSSNRGNIVTSNGQATFNASMTNYQNEHPDEFDLHFTFEITVKYTAEGGWSGGSHGFYLLGGTPFSSLGSNTVSRTGVFKYRPNVSDTFSSLSLEHFTGSYSFNTITNYRYIFGNCYLDGDRNKDSFLSWYTTNYPSSSVEFSSIVLKCTSELFDSYQNYSSPCIYQYDFVSGTSSKLSDGMGTNNNPYDYENQDSYSDSISGSFGYMTQNNNQTVTITNSNVNTNDISNVIGDIGDEDDSSSLLGRFSSLVALNSWVAVLASALSFLPSEFWTTLTSYFAVCLGILSTFLVLRYIFNLLS